ncbi:hypothetical protein GCM10010218_41210 [Streptomyces mashuensis]|uniref:Uncharacterized protein n=1 Tax=Streptomyces mashuensis TaxID=33904 RepID=A0A919B5C5_9ACTN|nr:hypothetical protein GCM10010218_41210 [Streptomyces mashuensis]
MALQDAGTDQPARTGSDDGDVQSLHGDPLEWCDGAATATRPTPGHTKAHRLNKCNDLTFWAAQPCGRVAR